jgi:hypothetical protein
LLAKCAFLLPPFPRNFQPIRERHGGEFLTPRNSAPTSEFAHQLAAGQPIVISCSEHHLEAMIFRGKRVAGFVLDLNVEALGK